MYVISHVELIKATKQLLTPLSTNSFASLFIPFIL